MSASITGDWGDMDLGDDAAVHYRLQLFVAGASTNSVRAIANLKAICEEHLPGRYQLEIIDVHKDYGIVALNQIVALPLLIRLAPAPQRRLIGDMSDTQKVLRGLGLL